MSKANEFAEKYSAKTSSRWRTYDHTATGESISFDPKTSEVSFNPVTKRFEAVVRENVASGNEQPGASTANPRGVITKTEQQFNPVTKKFETVNVEVIQTANGSKEIQCPESLDNGLPTRNANDGSVLI